ncbi:unnamed protein product [Adineta steineri]|uniref:Uncharacterized protein n=1 Tax=Adineta steineri TaxID=433720 RepID=A0A815KJF3_9BILA|nr:unnamed protein product [Adineta steineri]
MDTYGSIYKDYFNPSNPLENRLLYDDDGCRPAQFKFTIALETSITYILIVTTWGSYNTGAFLIVVSGPDTVDLKNIMNTSSVVQTVYASELTKKSSQYWRDCTSSKSYYEAIQVNAHRSGLYTFVSKSNMNTYGSIYKDYFNPSNPLGNRYSHDNNSCNQKEFRFTVALEISIIYILVVTTFTSDTVGEFSIFISGPNNVDLKNINYPPVTQKPPALFQQPNYSSELTTNSQTYSRDCQKSNYYYETIRMNVMKNGYYGLKSASSINTFGDIYKDDFNPMDPFENLLIQDYQSCADKDFTFIANLHTGTKYILVVTTLSPNITGNFSILTTGINTIILNRYGKYFILFVNH